VDRALDKQDSRIIIAALDGEFTVKRFRKVNVRVYLVLENPRYRPIEITEDRDFEVWGKVTGVVNHES